MLATANGATTIPLIDPEQRALFTANQNRTPFLFKHNLCEVEQFQPEYLRMIAQRFVDADTPIYCSPGRGRVDASFDAPDEGGKHFTPAEALAQMADEELLFKMPKISRLPEYQPFIESSFNQILELCGLPTKGYELWRSISVFMAGPRRITPYHLDTELNFLCQVTGTKSIWVADGNDREILTQEELERFWRGDGQSSKFKAVAEQRAQKFTLSPGVGIHIPINFPHWVENGEDVSMSVSLSFRPLKYQPGAVHRFNSYLRQMHLKPTPPGKIAWLDAAKEQAYGVAKATVWRLKGWA